MAQAERIATLARAYAAPATRLGVGVADPEVLPLLEGALSRAGVPAFNPEGLSRQRDPLYALLAALTDFASTPNIQAVSALLRCPDVLAWLRRENGNLLPAAILAEFDALSERHLPPTLDAALSHGARFPTVRHALEALRRLRATLIDQVFPSGIVAGLTEIFAGRRIDVGSALTESAEAWKEMLREMRVALEAFDGAGLALSEACDLALNEFARERQAGDRPADAIDLLGWLELLWEDAPHLVVAGFNEGHVPDAVVGDAFLPEALRVVLGLRTNGTRFARDAYLLEALMSCRQSSGQLDVLFGKTSAVGDPLQPSRLLLRCSDAELPDRVTWLFRPDEPAGPGFPWARAWRLRPRRVPTPTKISVTALADWLACPFRFYLRHGLGVERVDSAKAELDARDFGTLLHVALQRLGNEEALRECTDPGLLGDFLIQRFESEVRGRYGSDLTLPLVVQFEAARQRLRAAAVVEARERAAGWRQEKVEWNFEIPLGGLVLSGKIDRIDRHADGRVRVIDYKTGDLAREPAEVHLRAIRKEDQDRPDWLRCTADDGRSRAWADLQLPLYVLALGGGENAAVTCGYFNLPKAVGETAVTIWESLTPDLMASARFCAEGAAAAVVAGVFWPPAELKGREAERDEFAELFHRGSAASVEWEGAR